MTQNLRTSIFFFKKLFQWNLNQSFSNLQLELLKLYADNISEKDLKAIQRLIARYFVPKYFGSRTKEADKILDEKGYTAEKLLSGHERNRAQKRFVPLELKHQNRNQLIFSHL